jgi:hypothetical protein
VEKDRGTLAVSALLWILGSVLFVCLLIIFACGRSPRYDDIGAIEHDGRTHNVLCDKCGKSVEPFSGHQCAK